MIGLVLLPPTPSVVGSLTKHHPLHARVSSAIIKHTPWPARHPRYHLILSSHRGALGLLRTCYQPAPHEAFLYRMPHQMHRFLCRGKRTLRLRRPAPPPQDRRRQRIPLPDFPRWCGHRQLPDVARPPTWHCLYLIVFAIPSLKPNHLLTPVPYLT